MASISAFLPVLLLSRMPHEVLMATVGRSVYFLAYYVIRYRYHVVVQNLARAFPERTYREIHTLAKEFYLHFSAMIVEMIRSISIGKKELTGRVHIKNKSLLNNYHRQGRPMIGLLGHYGNWESLNILASELPFQVNALYKPQAPAPFCYLMRRIRARFGMNLIPAENALKQLMQLNDRSTLSLFIADQFPGNDRGYRMEFMNQPARLFDGAEKLARRIDAVVFYVALEKNPLVGWDVTFSVISDNAKDAEPGEITRCFGERLQQTIRKMPAYWLWSHRRWK
ncbi:lysophospholipid acyltransferase family protein [Parapedobacter deserti]|uniref:Lysophospholipid acyltransferase family protein n=1 Tax=Parapedobacter deserti TaxID=1912957 RepID=A0ABV7JPQ9_9SPHI